MMFNRASLVTLVVMLQCGACSQAMAEDLTLATYGGAWGAALSKAAVQPIAQERGLTIAEVTLNGLNEIKVQVDAGAVAIDLIDVTGLDCAMGAKQSLFEQLDYGKINAEGVDPALVRPNWIGGPAYASTVLAYSTEKYSNGGPKTWADLWDIEKFPGNRAMWNNPYQMLEIALLADGVKGEDLYPLDLERAFAKLRQIKPYITVWWSSGGQAAQLLNDGEVDLLPIWSGRASTVIASGAQAAFTYNQALLGIDCLAVPKGAKNRDLAMQTIGDLLRPDIQAAIPKAIDYGPINSRAFETGRITPEQMKSINSSAENLSLQFRTDDEWWADNLAKIQPMWDAFMQE
ncbi:hypothetical protein ASD00_31390 [Ensifer sp. Root31]|uniref:ABC transporter substrate-binding protein n=1 Tax=Ensifer sp. Root31 TaxID=1736512 RepID=UPI00070E6FB6|nr:ABC transporter substrate-binding protein [Ensifer sp. Root31]KQU86394.1 hypothetical protein ASD00_31390 [Ensifer sp. Root31]